LTKMRKKPLIVTTDTLSKFSLTKFLMENFDSDNGPLAHWYCFARVRWRTTKSWLLRRKQRSAYNTLLKELHTEDPNEFRNYFRMDKTTLKMLLQKVRPLIKRKNTKLREAISAAYKIVNFF
jgi:hypothetical protein